MQEAEDARPHLTLGHPPQYKGRERDVQQRRQHRCTLVFVSTLSLYYVTDTICVSPYLMVTTDCRRELQNLAAIKRLSHCLPVSSHTFCGVSLGGALPESFSGRTCASLPATFIVTVAAVVAPAVAVLCRLGGGVFSSVRCSCTRALLAGL